MDSFLTLLASRSHVFSVVKSIKPDRFQYELIPSSRSPGWNGLFFCCCSMRLFGLALQSTLLQINPPVTPRHILEWVLMQLVSLSKPTKRVPSLSCRPIGRWPRENNSVSLSQSSVCIIHALWPLATTNERSWPSGHNFTWTWIQFRDYIWGQQQKKRQIEHPYLTVLLCRFHGGTFLGKSLTMKIYYQIFLKRKNKTVFC